MDTLQEQRMIEVHKLGRRDYQKGRPEMPPTYLNEDERNSYLAGYRGEKRRAENGGI